MGIAITLSNNTKLTIVNVYVPPDVTRKPVDFQSLLDQLPQGEFVFCGDFNAKHVLWGSPRNDCRGISLCSIIEENDLCVLNDESPTFVGGNASPSHLDLTLCTLGMANRCDWQVHEDETLGSDHLLIELCIQCETTREVYNGKPNWKIKEADWANFRVGCLGWKEEDIIDANIDVYAANITSAIIGAADDSIPKTSGGQSRIRKPWWSPECQKAVNERKKALRLRKRHYNEVNHQNYLKLKYAARDTIRKAQSGHWMTFCNALNQNTQTGAVWKKLNAMNGKRRSFNIPNLKNGDEYVTNGNEKADLLAKAFADASRDENQSPEFLKRKEIFYSQHPSLEIEPNEGAKPINLPFSEEELNKALSLKKDSAAGEDKVKYSMLKHLPRNAKRILLNFFNTSWLAGEVPKEWRKANVIPLPKPGKERTKAESYRPVSLTSTLCKTLETMVNIRLQFYLESNRLIDENQSGFRKGRSTTDHLVRLQQVMSQALLSGNLLCVVFVDLTKAFDLVWLDGLLFKLGRIGITGIMFRWIKSFLSDRRIQVNVGRFLSAVQTLENGTPQGSVISPTLFNIMINDIQKSSYLDAKTELAKFADDSTIWRKGRNFCELQKNMQKALDKFMAWANDWGFKVSEKKTVGMLVSRDRGISRMTLCMNGKTIEFKDQTKFLGVIFDRRLTWKPHIDETVDRCTKILNLMRKITGSTWGANRVTLMMVYRALIRSVLDYGSLAFMNCAPLLLRKLDTIQYKALCIATGVGQGTGREALLQEVGELPLSLRRKELATRYWAKISQLGERSPTFVSLQKTRYVRDPRKKSFGQGIRETIKELQLGELVINEHDPPAIAPWTLPIPPVNLDLLQKT